ncbi:MAG: hypothetical protein BTN85_1937 [Candidatus Methanohalarchaeum thermophilum]|uniref:Uncharacterized protein n=1 Tax=Methanohalarchaeum thermophilum TaxID=1903181 RepID=A0A1Q6DSE7_METT1|nr:MAG: hypothetical protein BTN85_1937 [Candidatus Methanohalarchaeum thermophilum]
MVDFLTPDFEVNEEFWNEYILEDGTKLKHKIILCKVLIPGIKEEGDLVVGTGTKRATTVFAPEEMKGEPRNSPIPPDEVEENIVDDDVGIKEKNEKWNSYKLKGELVEGIEINVKPAIAQILKTDLIDPVGEPVYKVNSETLTKINVPKEVKNKLQKELKKIKVE